MLCLSQKRMVVTKDRPLGPGRSVPMFIIVECEDHSAIQTPYKFSDCSLSKLLLFKKWANPGLFFIYFRPSEETLQFFTTNKCEKISIQDTVPGFELTTFGTWASSHNQKIKAPAATLINVLSSLTTSANVVPTEKLLSLVIYQWRAW